MALETLLRAAEGSEHDGEVVRADFERQGFDAWLSAAIARRLDPELGARVVPQSWSADVSAALEGFYAFWGRWFPGEYRRVRREWVVLQARWRGSSGAPAPAVDSVTTRLFEEGLVDVRPLAVPVEAGGFEAALEPPAVEVGPSGGAAAPEGRGEGGDGEAAEEVERGMEEWRESAPIVHAGGGASGRLPDGTEILADVAGDMALAAASGALDAAVRGGARKVDGLRAAWLRESGFWFQWPEFGRWQERER